MLAHALSKNLSKNNYQSIYQEQASQRGAVITMTVTFLHFLFEAAFMLSLHTIVPSVHLNCSCWTYKTCATKEYQQIVIDLNTLYMAGSYNCNLMQSAFTGQGLCCDQYVRWHHVFTL